MGMTIDTDRANEFLDESKAYYEKRLKTDMTTMLENLKLLIDEFDSGCGWDGYIKKIDAQELIQQKINKLKEDQEGEE